MRPAPRPTRPLYQAIDWTLVAVVGALCLVGLVMIYSTTHAFAPDPTYYLRRQAFNLVVGLGVLAACLAVDYRWLLRQAGVIYLAGLVPLLAVLVIGRQVAGTQGWIPVGPFSFQPAEVAKVTLIVSLAAYLGEARPPQRWRDLAAPLAMAAGYLVPVLLQPDAGTAVVLAGIALGMLFVAQVPGRLLGWLAGLGLAGASAAVVVTWAGWVEVVKPHQMQRLLVLIRPDALQKGAAWNVTQSVIALGSGRLFGRGLFSGPQTQLAFLPSRHTDFIFSAVGEELGFLGAGGVLGAYYLLSRRILEAAELARDRPGSLLAAGILILLAIHVVVSVGMALGVLPVMGIPLPFLSYGGTNLVASLAGVGLVLNVAARRHP